MIFPPWITLGQIFQYLREFQVALDNCLAFFLSHNSFTEKFQQIGFLKHVYFK